MHRVAQVVGHLTARVAPDEAALARRILPGSAWPLFEQMPVADRRHGLDVAQRLLAGGFDDADLLAAALLHDAAKGRRLRLWHRVTGVVLAAAAPGLLRRMAAADPGSRGYPWYLFLHHAEISARLALDAGVSARGAAFIHGEPAAADAGLASALRRADDAS